MTHFLVPLDCSVHMERIPDHLGGQAGCKTRLGGWGWNSSKTVGECMERFSGTSMVDRPFAFSTALPQACSLPAGAESHPPERNVCPPWPGADVRSVERNRQAARGGIREEVGHHIGDGEQIAFTPDVCLISGLCPALSAGKSPGRAERCQPWFIRWRRSGLSLV